VIAHVRATSKQSVTGSIPVGGASCKVAKNANSSQSFSAYSVVKVQQVKRIYPEGRLTFAWVDFLFRLTPPSARNYAKKARTCFQVRASEWYHPGRITSERWCCQTSGRRKRRAGHLFVAHKIARYDYFRNLQLRFVGML